MIDIRRSSLFLGFRGRWASNALCLLALAACSPSESKDSAKVPPRVPAAATSDAPPIRIVSFTSHARTLHARELLETLDHGCRTAKKLPDRDLPLTDSDLKRLVGHRSETLFDKGRYAVFDEATVLFADPRDNCTIKQFSTWHAEVHLACDHGWQGASPSQPEVSVSKPEVEDMTDRSSLLTCPIKGELADVPDSKTPVRMVNGVPCQSLEQSLALKLGDPYKPTREEADTCLFSKLPFYAGNRKLPVVVSMESDHPENRANADYTVELFTEGTPISADRFTKEAVQQWINQPAWKVIKR